MTAMQLKKEILLFYTLLIISAGVLIAAERIPLKEPKATMKCCKRPQPAKSTSPLNFITEGILHFSV